MKTTQDRVILLLRAYRTVPFCDECLALKMGTWPHETQEALSIIRKFHGFWLGPGSCSECLRETVVVRALAN